MAEIQKEDYFDRIPDPILLLIFNKLLDAKSLCSCISVSKRFASLVPQVDSIFISMNQSKPKKPILDSSISRSGSSWKSSFTKNLVFKFMVKPFQLLNQVLSKKPTLSAQMDESVHVLNWIGSVVKSFSEIESIKVELPCYGGEIGVNKSIPLLKWEAVFGKELDRCVMIGAKSIVRRKDKPIKDEDHDHDHDQDQLFSDEELKLRVIWIISCLIASSARHNLMKKIVGKCPNLKNAVISDSGKQGKLCMGTEEIRELRNSIGNSNESSSSSSQMGYVGNLVMKLWYLKELELPGCGKVMKGATMVLIRPDGKTEQERGRESVDGLCLRGAFDGEEVFGEAAMELLRKKEKRMYRLEMNSF